MNIRLMILYLNESLDIIFDYAIIQHVCIHTYAGLLYEFEISRI